MPRLGNKRVDEGHSRRKLEPTSQSVRRSTTPFRNVVLYDAGFVLRRGEVKKGVRELVKNIREVFYPYTGMNIQVHSDD
jgi:hypothetical protein